MTVGGEDDAGDVVDGAGGAVVAGNPLGCGEGDGAGFDGDVDLGVVELAGRVGEVGGDVDGGLLGDEGGVARRAEAASRVLSAGRDRVGGLRRS